jgi:hypothetical protein
MFTCSMHWLRQECSQKKVFVLPAFETAPRNDRISAHKLAHTAAAHDKQGLQGMVEQGLVWQFALNIFREVSPRCTT